MGRKRKIERDGVMEMAALRPFRRRAQRQAAEVFIYLAIVTP
jgi:hypothetical protein